MAQLYLIEMIDFLDIFHQKAKLKKIKIVTFGKDKKSDVYPLRIIENKKLKKFL